MVPVKKILSEDRKKHDTQVGLKHILAEYSTRHDTRELAKKLDIEYPTMMRKLNPNDDQDLHVSELVKFIEATKYTWKDLELRKAEEPDLTLLDEIELRLGRVVTTAVKRPKYDFDFHGLSRLIKESSEATRAISEAFTDGKVTPVEAENCIKELHDLVYISMQLIQHLEKIEMSGEAFKLTT